jgi:hypothetical protein
VRQHAHVPQLLVGAGAQEGAHVQLLLRRLPLLQGQRRSARRLARQLLLLLLRALCWRPARDRHAGLRPSQGISRRF